MAIVSCGNLLAAFAGSVHGVIAGRAVAGFGYSAAVIGTLTLLGALAPHTSRARVFSLYEFLIGAGLAVSTALAGLAAEWVGWRAGFGLGSLLAVLGLVAAAVSLGRGRRTGRMPPPPEPERTPRIVLPGTRGRAWSVGLVLLLSFILSYAWTGLFYTLYRFMVDLGFILGPWTLSVALEGGGFRIAAWMVASLTGASALAFFGLRKRPAPSLQEAQADVGERPRA